jgi:hypothetical protein
VIAHLGGMPVEEALLPLAGGAAALVLVRTWLASHLRRIPQRGAAPDSDPSTGTSSPPGST